ncbi:discoidin domain-containing protein [Clostridium tertium]|jgi:F5/8 type C domain/Melibiase/beta-1,4-mannooligosaccharide phosphorylase|uniref:Discoidin domain-containing protein n=1 Tax=Clostridium tertium TaxID=1559 RepID=A0A9X3XP15_9CLOT|nr:MULTISPECIES: discoidin domain-containing protein [Clostridium]MBS5305928.1 discoidin domain-containing protein [Clostridium sp.]MDB1920963.1 discoidin domain-containing protein [Clostridium tertium]MDB1925494.1 discoidin domain-containing protein [Clostridium tertium]MDB1928576.1 discoidin domain-containing protein [Clostridium tertium]MDB1943629.1 discoidin domain-containing protein [Clostridium tertium]
MKKRILATFITAMCGLGFFSNWTSSNAYNLIDNISVEKLDTDISQANENVFLNGNGIALEVDNRGATCIYLVDENGVKTKATTSLDTADFSGYPIIGGQKIRDFVIISKNLEENINSILGVGNRLTIISKSSSTNLIRKIVLETSNSNPGAIYSTVSYKAESNDLLVDSFHENEYTMSLGQGPFLAYQGCADQQGANTIVNVTNGYNHNSGQNNYSVGVPFSYVYNSVGGIGIGDASTSRREFKLPIIGKDNTVSLGMEWNGQTLKKGAETAIGTSVITATNGDYYSGLKSYAEVMKDKGISAPASIPDIAYDSRWESWGFEFDFTIEKIVNKLDELKAMGIKQITLDDGWYTYAGDWKLSPQKFPNGNADMKYLTDEIHKRGMTAILWWRPVDGGINSKLVSEHPEWFIKNSQGNMVRLPGPGGGNGGTAGYALCPNSEGSIQHHKDFVTVALEEWGFDGFKEDYVWGIPKCYDSSHKHSSLSDTLENQYKFYEAIYEQSIAINPDTFIELCNCGTPQDFYSTPYVNHAPTADPISRVQTRTRVKAFKAIFGDDFPVTTDHNSVWLPSALGTGSVMITKHTTLSSSDREQYNKYFGLARDLELAKGEFIGNLYKYGIDPLESYVIRKGEDIYYSFYKDNSSYSGNIEIKGLDSNATYRIEDYVNNRVIARGVKGPTATINTSFTDNLLVRAIPDDTPAEVTTFDVGNNTILSSTDSGNSKYLNAVSTTLEKTATIDSLSIYIGNNSENGKLQIAIYDDNNGKPGTKKAYVEEFVPTKNSWNTKKVVNSVTLPSGQYWLVFQPDNDVLQTKTNPSSMKQSANNNPYNYNILPNSFPIGTGYNAYKGDVSFYATFKEASSQAIPQNSWALKYVDSEETTGENGRATNSFDGNNNTIWHTKYSGGNAAPMPHEIQIDLRGVYNINQINYLPRQDGGTNGTIKDYEVYLSLDGVNWGQPISKGTFESNSTEKIVKFNETKSRYVKLKALSEINNKQFTTVADLKVFGWEISKIEKPLQNAETYLNIPTYDGLNQSTHPDVKYFKNGWNGYKYWMIMTPNRTGSSVAENPSILASNDGINWEVPAGVTNPIAPMPQVGHNCDVDMIYNEATDELWVYWVESDDITKGWVKLIKSKDGVNWSSQQVVVDDNRAKYSTLSPSIIFKDNKYYMWSVNTGNSGWNNQSNKVELRESSDGVNWSNPTVVNTLAQDGSQIWHVNVEYIPSKNEYWAIYPAYKNGTGSDKTELYYAKSSDGVNWTTYKNPILSKGTSGKWDDMEIYRSCFVYDEDTNMIKVWYGAVSQNPQIWKIGFTENDYDKFIEGLTQ